VIVRSYYLPESFADANDVHELEARSLLSTSLLQNRPELIDSIVISKSDFRQFYNRPPDISIYRHDHILAFIEALMKDRDLINQTGESSICAEIIFTPEGLGGFRRIGRMNSLSFRIAKNGQSHVLDWLSKTDFSD